MIKSAAYISFEEGFLKEAEAQGCDVEFLKGLIAQAEEVQNSYAELYDQIEKESGDKLFKVKLACDLSDYIIKHAEDQPWNDWLMSKLTSLGGQGNEGMTGGLGGAGIGGLAGLLLGQLTGNPLIGLLLGGLGGGGLGYLFGSGRMNGLFGGAKGPAGATDTPIPPHSPEDAAKMQAEQTAMTPEQMDAENAKGANPPMTPEEMDAENAKGANPPDPAGDPSNPLNRANFTSDALAAKEQGGLDENNMPPGAQMADTMADPKTIAGSPEAQQEAQDMASQEAARREMIQRAKYYDPAWVNEQNQLAHKMYMEQKAPQTGMMSQFIPAMNEHADNITRAGQGAVQGAANAMDKGIAAAGRGISQAGAAAGQAIKQHFNTTPPTDPTRQAPLPMPYKTVQFGQPPAPVSPAVPKPVGNSFNTSSVPWGKPSPQPMIKTQSAKEWLDDLLKVAMSSSLNYANAQPVLAGPQAQTMSSNPLLPPQAAIAVPPQQDLFTPGGTLLTHKKPTSNNVNAGFGL